METLIKFASDVQVHITNGISDPYNTCGLTGTKVFEINSKDDFNSYDEFNPNGKDFYRYLTKADLEYIKKDMFRIGPIGKYHGNDIYQDNMEGFVSNILERPCIVNHQFVYSGFNYLLLCGTYLPESVPESDHLKTNFGECVIKIKDVKKFIQVISDHINPKSVSYYKVSYQPVKMFCSKLGVKMDEDMFMPKEMFDFLQSVGALTSIYLKNKQGSKGYLYSNEHELRIAFEMDSDQSDYVSLNGLGLVDLIEVIKE